MNVFCSCRTNVHANRLPENQDDHQFERAIDQWIERLDAVGQRSKVEYKSVLKALLLGGELDSRRYGEVTDCVASILEAIAARTEVALIIPGINHADEATRQVIARLSTKDRILMLATQDSADHNLPGGRWVAMERRDLQQVQGQLAGIVRAFGELTDDERLLLRIALIFRSGALRVWLKTLWRESMVRTAGNDGVSWDDRFERAFRRLLQLGVLRVSGRLADIRNRARTYREVNFASAWMLEQVIERVDLPPGFAAQIQGMFANALSHRISGDRDIDGVRRKLLVCHYLRELPPQHLTKRLALDLPRLWLIVAERAKAAGFLSEAARRITECRELLSEINCLDVGRDDPASSLLAFDVISFCLALPISYSAKATDLVNEAERLMSRANDLWVTSAHAKKAFALYRSFWSYQNSWGSKLSEAELAACALRKRFWDSAVVESKPLHIETQHVLAVTLFAMGKLQDTLDEADAGVQVCEGQLARRGEFDDSLMFGSHCGGGCCNVLATFAEVLMSGDYERARPRIKSSKEYADKIQDEASRTIVYAYLGMLALFADQFDEAQQRLADALEIRETRASKRWRLMARLLLVCTAIARCVNNQPSASSTRVQLKLSKHCGIPEQTSGADVAVHLRRAISGGICEWRDMGLDYLPTWLAFEGVAEHLSEHGNAIAKLDEAEKLAISREERLYLPEIVRWRSVLFECQNKRDQACADRDTARQLAENMGATLFQNKLV